MKRALFLLLAGSAAWGATATPVAISTVSRSSNVVTVTDAAAHGLAVNQGFCIGGVTDSSFNVCSTVASVTSGTVFTFAQTAANGSSSGGTTLAAKKLIILSTPNVSNGIEVRAVCWITTTAGVPAAAQSAWSGASTAELNALAAGNTQEKVITPTYGTGTTKANIQTDLQNQCNALQASLTNASVQPGQFTGGFCDAVGCSF